MEDGEDEEERKEEEKKKRKEEGKKKGYKSPSSACFLGPSLLSILFHRPSPSQRNTHINLT